MVDCEHTSLVESWFQDIFTKGNLKILDNLVAPDFIAHAQGREMATCDREAYKAWLCWYRTTFTDAEWTIHDVITSADKVVVRYSGWTTYRGGLVGIPSSDQRVLETGILIFRIVDGKIQELWCEMSDLQVMQQLQAFTVSQQKREKQWYESVA